MKLKMNNKGLSLVELMITIAIASVLIITAMSFLVNGTKMYGRGLNEVNLQDEAQVTLNQIEDILMEATQNVGYDASTGVLSAEMADGSTEYVTFVPSSCQLYYYNSKDTAQSLLANYVTNFYVVSSATNDAKVTLHIELTNKTRTYQTDQTVYLRNAANMTVSLPSSSTAPAAPTSVPVPTGSGVGDVTPPAVPTTAPTNTPTPTSTPTPTNTPVPAEPTYNSGSSMSNSSVLIYENNYQGSSQVQINGLMKQVPQSWGSSNESWAGNSTSTITVNGNKITLSSNYVDLGNGLKMKVTTNYGSVTFVIVPTAAWDCSSDDNFVIETTDGTATMKTTINVYGDGDYFVNGWSNEISATPTDYTHAYAEVKSIVVTQ